MGRFVFCVILAFVAGTGLATVFTLFTTAMYAAVAKGRAGIDSPVYEEVWTVTEPMFSLNLGFAQLSPSMIHVVGVLGFLVGAAVIVWQFYFQKQSHEEPAEDGQIDQSEV